MNWSIVRHILTALGAVLAFFGLGSFTGLIDILLQNLGAIQEAVMTIVGVVMAIIGYFQGRKEQLK